MQFASAPNLHAKSHRMAGGSTGRGCGSGVTSGEAKGCGEEGVCVCVGGGGGMHVPPAMPETGRVRMPEPHETLHAPARHSECARAHARVPHEQRFRHRPSRALACGHGERTPTLGEPGVSGTRGDEARLVGARHELPSAILGSDDRVGHRVHAVERARLSCQEPRARATCW